MRCGLLGHFVNDLFELSLARLSRSLSEYSVGRQNAMHFGDELLFCTVVYQQNAASLAKLVDVML
jgi:hypothetical protein